MTRHCQQLSGLLVVLTVVAGCVRCERGGKLVTGRRMQAVLSASRARHISMFGDIPNRPAPTYFTRAAMSLRRHTFTEVGADFDPDVEVDSQRLVFASTRHNVQSDLYFKAFDGVAVTQLTSDPAADIQPAISPDRRRVAFASNRTGNWDIWIINVGGGPPVQVTRGDGDAVHPSWSPDGTRLAYCSLAKGGGQWELWIVDASAGSTRRFIGYGLFPEWSPVGDTILFQRARERGSRWFSIWTITLVGGEPRYPTEIAASATNAMILPTWSPDGSRIAFAATANGQPPPGETAPPTEEEMFDVWVMNADGSGKMRLTDGHTHNCAPTFGSDGRVFFASRRSGHENIWSLMLPTGPAGSQLGEIIQTARKKSIAPDGLRTAQTAAARDDL